MLLAVAIIPPGTRRTDRFLKAVEYAAAAIPHYRVIDLTEPASIAVDVSRPTRRDYFTRTL